MHTTNAARRTILSALPVGGEAELLPNPTETPSQRLIELAREMTAILRSAPYHNQWRIVVDPVAGRLVLEDRR